MPIDTEAVKTAIDKFEDDDFVGAKEIIKQQIAAARDEYLQTKLQLKEPAEVEKEEENDDDPDQD